jgi:lipopolysaccharide export system permease protein
MSSDSEIVALRAIGFSLPVIIRPAIILGILVGILSLQTSFHIAPWGNRQFEVLITKLGASKPGVTIKEGTFSQGFFDLVVYANKVDPKSGKLSQVFIYDEREPKTPITVIAREGRLIQDAEKPGHSASLRLIDGNIHRTFQGRHTKIDFSTYDIFLSDPATEQFRNKSPQSLTIDELRERLKLEKLSQPDRLELETEFHKRIAIAFACLLFSLIGTGLGTVTNRRNVKSGGMIICVGLIVIYYVLYVALEGASRKGQIPPMIAMWLTNALFSVAAAWSLRRAST